MRITFEVEDDSLEQAHFYGKVKDTSSLIYEALKALIERESARRLAALGGSEPQARYIPRRRMPRQMEAKADPLRG